MKVFKQYLIYDAMGMIGSVGGTLGLFLGFSMTGIISWVFKKYKRNIQRLTMFGTERLPPPVPLSEAKYLYSSPSNKQSQRLFFLKKNSNQEILI